MNTYGYVGGNPLKYFDPYGLCKIEVRFKRIANTRWYHAHIISTDTDGGRNYFRGGPDGSSNWGSVWGDITTEYGEYRPGTKDWDSGKPPSVAVLDNNESCGCYDQGFVQSLDKIKAAQISYSPLLQNSNSVIGTALRNMGLRPNTIPVRAPAFYTNLLTQ